MKRLKYLLNERVERVRNAEIQRLWSAAAIERETEFLTLVLELLYNYEASSVESLKVEHSELERTRKTLLKLYLWGKIFQFDKAKHVDINDELFEQYFAVATDDTKYLVARILLKYYEQEMKLEDAPKCIAFWQNKINKVQPYTQWAKD